MTAAARRHVGRGITKKSRGSGPRRRGAARSRPFAALCALAITLGGSERKPADTPAIAPATAPHGCILIAVVGAHLTGQPLNWQLTQRRARLVRATRTHGDYRLYAVPNTAPPKPGLVYAPGFGGQGIEVEVWAMPEDTVGSFLNSIPPPLSLGTCAAHLSAE